MASSSLNKPHAVCVPFPSQGHMNPVLSLAKILHAKGFHITFVLSEYNRRRLYFSQGSVRELPDFRFFTISDGLPYSDENATQNVPDLCESTMKHCLGPFRTLLAELKEEKNTPPVSCIVADGAMSFTLDAARELNIPEILFWTTSACAFLAYLNFQQLVDRGVVPLKDEAALTSGYLDTEVDWIPGLRQGIRLKDLPSFLRVTDIKDKMFNYIRHETNRASMATAIVLNTFEALEVPVLEALRQIIPSVYAVGPLSLLSRSLISNESRLASINTSLWKEDTTCITWLNGKRDQSVVYVNFGSVTVINGDQFKELAWGLANSGYDFLWVIRPDLVRGEKSVLPADFLKETSQRALLADWCDQEEVLRHRAVGVFLTHSGWNSTLESISGGVPMISWAFFAEQQMNCFYSRTDWGVGMEMDSSLTRTEVERLIREMMEGEEGKKMRKKAAEWKARLFSLGALPTAWSG
ncbi:7-deoxyloganetin glucosyltransferase-like [Phalaenopsis equestris]|uniref:7-deoxyloganetin glucosyltransferase-like n=1 Tax=Phalaenopsis equestris TaxID=78828 RepID=UPI0009E20938|nr:7-deoxyloganetin glucosyltransferase-like [Phalaenopsis equestris]